MLEEGGMRLLAFVLLCGCAAAHPVTPPPAPPRMQVDPGECAGDGGLSCYRRGRQLLESRRAEVAQESMESVDKACAAGMQEACDLAELAFKAPRRIGGGNPPIPPPGRDQHPPRTLVARRILRGGGGLRGSGGVQDLPRPRDPG